MRLNKDCIRNILLFVESECVYYDHPQYGRQQKSISYKMLCENSNFAEFDKYDIYYTVSKLFEGKYINGYVIPKGNYSNFNIAHIEGLTLKGHDLIDNIRPESVWKQTKGLMEKVGDFSIGVMSQVAGETMAAYTKAMINLK